MRLQDLVEVCRRLNQCQVKYVLVGGFAILIHGYERTTRDIDFLIETSDENVRNIKKALHDLVPDACDELKADDVRKNIVVRMMGEEIVIDLMKEVGPIDYKAVIKDSFIEEIDGIPIRVAGLDSMIELKRGVRERDQKDFLFLQGKKEYLERKK